MDSCDQTQGVLNRYSEGAQQREEALCCPVDYDAGLLKLLPAEIIERDYGCGDPSRYVRDGDTVLDLGSGGGKICYMAAQLVGAEGSVIGVDMNDDMLDLARRHQSDMARKLGGDRVRFVKGFIQDLALDLKDTEQWLSQHAVKDANDLIALEEHKSEQRRSAPLVADATVDLVISNCVLNLVRESDRQQMIAEIFRVLRPGGRVAISDIVSDKYVSDDLKADSDLWSGCISGAFQEQEFLTAFADAGFVGAAFDKWDNAPWQVVSGIEFRAVTLTAGKPVLASGQATHEVMYRGPYACIELDSGATFMRGQRTLIDSESFAALTSGPFADDMIDCASASADTGDCCSPSNGSGCC
ncbi:MAG TPA: methyltransferase domain-containing protein [Chromatiaceae bacterium]|jgi:SAM-dependent methyltransferase|nr:methyltransferase domain-containing protein [Chromatiaceae bacterium]HIN82137.1 methyltransferase domain-containing protein [Chromatiales bacterium]HIO53861.1 methyltransferase domain-containing protein [Chromatiales bacterium]